MAGVYFHIPFCKQACHYCDFHFRIGLKDEDRMLEAMLEELRMERSFPFPGALDSVYFGGGTPSLLDPERIRLLLNACEEHFGIAEEAEITLEANPDDLAPHRIETYRSIGVNRLSIGVQSFDDELLERFNRPHTGKEAAECLRMAAESGLDSYSADLIFGMPGYEESVLERDLDRMIASGVPHLSTYGLTIEPGTVLARSIEKGAIPPPEEEKMKAAYERIMERLQDAGYGHYEISNFALPGHRAVHNASYWTGEAYLGIGPSAHSFDGMVRCWNIAKNARYIRGVEEGAPEREQEPYDPIDRANERLMTRLRTEQGVDPAELRTFGVELWQLRKEEIHRLKEERVLMEDEGKLRLTRNGKLLADRVCERLFILKDDR
jgi:oxygen-independent coproporphyrinogen-3 oxidase